jgi:hypothetical protein
MLRYALHDVLDGFIKSLNGFTLQQKAPAGSAGAFCCKVNSAEFDQF